MEGLPQDPVTFFENEDLGMVATDESDIVWLRACATDGSAAA